MKIKKIEFCDINSLAGEWSIDFESPDFLNSSMFCISGPTGSGKTSILDAICLALYGKTPRQGAIKGEVNEVMTYGTKKCYAKVFFECRGIVYSSRWEQRRAPKSNKLQKYSWMLTNEDTKNVVSSFTNQAEIETEMTRIIGLDFGQFTKSMMLAQGEFNKFLKCNENERAAILEKLTGDEIYRKIAVSVHALYAKSNEAVVEIERKIGDVSLLSEADLEALEEKIKSGSAQKNALATEIEKLERICTWFEQLHEIEKRETDVKKQLTDAEQSKTEFEASDKKLENALRAQEIEATYTELCSIRKNIERMESQLQSDKEKLPNCEESLKNAEETSAAKKSALEKINADYIVNEKIWEQVSSMDADIRNLQKKVTESENAVAKANEEVGATAKKIEELEGSIDKNGKRLEKANDYIRDNAKDEEIESCFSLLKSGTDDWKNEAQNAIDENAALERAKNLLNEFDKAQECKKENLLALQKFLEQHKADAELANALPEMTRCANEMVRHHREAERLQKEMSAKKTLIGNLDGECKCATAALENLKAEKEKIVEEDIPVIVEELRKNLQKGKACPVCGSLEHPACGETCSEVAQIESDANSLNDFADKLRRINEEIEQQHRAFDSASNKKQHEEALLQEFSQKFAEETAAENSAVESLNAALQPWNKTATLENAQEILQKLTLARDEFSKKKQEAENLQATVLSAEVERTKLNGNVESANEKLQKSMDRAAMLSQKIREQFAPWFSDIQLDNVDARLSELDKKSKVWKKAVNEKTNIERELEADKASLESSRENRQQAKNRLADATQMYDGQQRDLNGKRDERRKLFGEKSIDAERENARTQRTTAEREWDAATKQEQQKREVAIQLKNSISRLSKDIEEALPKLESSKSHFAEKLAEKNFADESQFVAATLPEAERKSLQEQKKKIDDSLMAARTSVKNVSDQFEQHQSKRTFTETEDVAKAEKDSQKSKLADLTVNLGAWMEQKKSDAEHRQKFIDMQKLLEQLKAKRSDWEQMQRWFNGNRLENGNGDVFVKFIQTITLKNLLRIANGYLGNMFPRYEMVTEEGTLNIQLIDHDNSDAIRPISNISGGEGFLVSLSLALGISTLASRNVSIDSMFLDEGFGTLDSKMLQETIVVLQKMQKEKGKMLGVITHVELVKNELTTHIEVTPQGGRSILGGAGVRRI